MQKHGSATIEIEDIAVFQLPVAGSEQLVVVAEAQHLASMMNQPFKVIIADVTSYELASLLA